MRNSSCPRLQPIAHKVFLFSFVYGGDPVMMHHFANHYFTLLGVRPNQSQFIIQMPANRMLLNATLNALREAKVPRMNILLRHSRYDDVSKLLATNEFIEKLSPGSLLINADGDELFQYPCRYEQCMQYGSCCASFRDRMALSGKVEELKLSPSIEEQFPLECNVRGKLHGFRLSKHTLLDPYWEGFELKPIQFISSHQLGWGSPIGSPGKNHTTLGLGYCEKHTRGSPYPIAHYTMTTVQRALLVQKVQNWAPQGNVYGGETYSCRRQSIFSNTSFSCGDYVEILKWMDANRPNRTWCQRPPLSRSGSRLKQ